jgi:hypothetical protein
VARLDVDEECLVEAVTGLRSIGPLYSLRGNTGLTGAVRRRLHLPLPSHRPTHSAAMVDYLSSTMVPAKSGPARLQGVNEGAAFGILTAKGGKRSRGKKQPAVSGLSISAPGPSPRNKHQSGFLCTKA